jgi:uncharacterized DUF497 family protein
MVQPQSMKVDITFDPLNDSMNQAQHGVSLDFAREIAWNNAICWNDDRYDYGETREIGLGLLQGRPFAWCSREGNKRCASSVCIAQTTGRNAPMNATFNNYYENTPEEEAEIQRGIEMDPDTYDLSDPRIVLKPFVFPGRSELAGYDNATV